MLNPFWFFSEFTIWLLYIYFFKISWIYHRAWGASYWYWRVAGMMCHSCWWGVSVHGSGRTTWFCLFSTGFDLDSFWNDFCILSALAYLLLPKLVVAGTDLNENIESFVDSILLPNMTTRIWGCLYVFFLPPAQHPLPLTNVQSWVHNHFFSSWNMFAAGTRGGGCTLSSLTQACIFLPVLLARGASLVWEGDMG